MEVAIEANAVIAEDQIQGGGNMSYEDRSRSEFLDDSVKELRIVTVRH